jgi:two-component system response regulator (stage 0 sporulation protein A)
MDLILPKMDGLTVLELLHQAKNRTPVIVTSMLDHSELIHCACTLGAAYYVCKPYQLEVVYQRMCQIVGWYAPSVWMPQAEPELAAASGVPDGYSSLETELTAVIRHLGIPAHIKGYQYIRESVLLALEDDNMLSYITKYLYPTIAKRHRTTSSSVERAIRHAIGIVWERGNAQAFEEWYGSQDCRPTNSEFLSLLVDKFRLEHQEECAQYVNRQVSV